MTLRPYQQDCIEAAAWGFVQYRRQLIVIPTGGGKTICFAEMARRFWSKRSERTLVLAHREELIEQAVDKIQRETGLTASIEKAERHADRAAPVVVASVATMQGDRLKSWEPYHFGLVVADEAHHAMADQWQNTLGHFDTRVLGVTATPGRSDNRSLANYFENVAYEIGLLELIEQGFLAPIMVKSIPLKIDLSQVTSTAGDFDSSALAHAIEPFIDVIVQHLAALKGRKILVFLPLIETSKKFVAACHRAGISAMHVDGGSPDRKDILKKYREGEFDLLSNAMLLTEGYDEPSVDCVVPLRPTRSTELLQQMVGRMTRLHPGKENGLLVDFLWLHERHNLARPASLVAKSPEEEEAITNAILGEEVCDLREAIASAEAEREAALMRALAEAMKKQERYLPLTTVAALLKDKKLVGYEPRAQWEMGPASEKQKAVLARFHIKCPPTSGEATLLLGRLFDRSRAKLASVGKVALLQRFHHPDPAGATEKEAKEWLDQKLGGKRAAKATKRERQAKPQ